MIRVLRLMEYVYSDAMVAEDDMGNWELPANGVAKFGEDKVIRSSIITNLDYKPDDATNKLG